MKLLEGAHLAPPERLPALLDAAASAMGVRAAVHLVDYEERYLYPWRAQEPAGEPLPVESTLAGRAYRHVVTVAAQAEPRLWLPLIDGVERLGVLEVEVGTVADLDDPGLHIQCAWLSKLVGHLVKLLDQYGDAVHRVRLPGQRSLTGQLTWSLLPPLTAGVDNFVVSGVVEPRHSVSGDAFDYALSETTASLMILDAVGHDLRSGLIAATALAAHRSGRHAGRGLYEQAHDIDAAIRGQFGPSAFATGVLAEVSLTTGRLRYLNAGHPAPVLMRGGRVVKPLTGGRTRPWGLGVGEFAIGEEFLEPDDWLVLHTDGVTEARDEQGRFFGDTRLADFLRREATAGHPPPETARRLIRAILAHQNGVLQDDAAIVLARWTAPGELSP
ncbi:PP2C family protein-serine/threonine phosphatase [Actinokineospora soli]|uniref:PP2C family protein-serine/threonine phosphatase n=1 Tax=Actinokineospora soli TaxID=1048753 RepID=A0ABW2TRD3_9PSEU